MAMLTFKVWLPGSGQSVWRRVEIAGQKTLHDLAEAILDAFEFDHDHLYAFYLSGKVGDRGTEYVHPWADGRKADKVRLGELAFRVGQKLLYLYDFGDQWPFQIRLERVTEGPEGETVVTKHGEPPPQYVVDEP